MDEAMMKAGGDMKRKELIAMFGSLDLEGDKGRGEMSEELKQTAKYGDYNQSKNLTDQRFAKGKK